MQNMETPHRHNTRMFFIGVKSEQILKALIKLYLVILAVVLIITYFAGVVMLLPNMEG